MRIALAKSAEAGTVGSLQRSGEDRELEEAMRLSAEAARDCGKEEDEDLAAVCEAELEAALAESMAGQPDEQQDMGERPTTPR